MKLHYVDNDLFRKFYDYQEVIKIKDLHYEKIKKKIEEKCVGNKIIFAYCLYPSFGKKLKIELFDSEKDNVKCWYNSDEETFSINSDRITDLLEITAKYSECLKAEDFFIEENHWYDGYENRILLFDGETYYYIYAENLAYYEKDMPCGKLIFSIIKEILFFLKESGVNEKYLQAKFPYL